MRLETLEVTAGLVGDLGELRLVRLHGGGYGDAQIVRMVDGRAAEPISVRVGDMPHGTAEEIVQTLAAAPLLAADVIRLLPALRAWQEAHRMLAVDRRVLQTAKRGGVAGRDPVSEASHALEQSERDAAHADATLYAAITNGGVP